MKLFYEFKNKLFVTYSALFLLITVILLIAFYTYTSVSIQQKSDDLLAQVSEKIVYKLDTTITSMNTTSLQVVSNYDLQNILLSSSEYTLDDNFFDYNYKKEVTYILASINSPLTSNARVSIFDLNKNYVSIGYLGTDRETFIHNFSKYDNLNILDTNNQQIIIYPPDKDNWYHRKPTVVFSLLRKIPYIQGVNRTIGYVEVAQPYALLEDAASIATDKSIHIVIMDDNNNIIYPYNELNNEMKKYYTSLAQLDKNTSTRPWDAQQEFLYTQHSDTSSWTVILTQNKEDYLSTLFIFRKLVLLYSILFYIIILILLLGITKRVTAPITQLRKSVESLTLSNPSIYLSDNGNNNELTMLTSAFNNTIERLNISMEQALTANRNQVQAHILAMQSQMNPHFLFNTLMGISGIAEESENTNIVAICDKLASMLRYISSFKDSTVPLADEILYTENYLNLMKIRYEDFLQYELSIEEAAKDIAVTKLILQPIVENCFSHGFKNISPPYCIKINISLATTQLCISVTDNGEGFTEKSLHDFREKIKSYQSILEISDYINNSEIGGLGLTNIFLRLHLKYGTSTVMTAQNNPSKGCTIRIFLPITNESR